MATNIIYYKDEMELKSKFSNNKIVLFKKKIPLLHNSNKITFLY